MVETHAVNAAHQKTNSSKSSASRPIKNRSRKSAQQSTEADRLRDSARKMHLPKSGNDGREALGLETCRCDHVGGAKRPRPTGDVLDQKAIGQASDNGQLDSCTHRGNSNHQVFLTTHTKDEEDVRAQGKHYPKAKSARAGAEHADLTIAALQKAFSVLNEPTSNLTLERARCIYDASSLLVDIARQNFKNTQSR